jgi:hypothetical protein
LHGKPGDVEPRNRKGIPQRGVDITLTYRVGFDHLAASIVVGNRTKAPLPLELSWLLEAGENLRVGGATVTVRFWRDRTGRSKFRVLRKRGTLHVVRQPPPDSLSADVWQRLHGVMESVA